ncbi:MAG: hypothetical protein Q7R49_01825 [Candidatus Daviesbacteria bacterium]|nr:hypothetical protein [Candidatus Daviesbacteria bacterium]
MLESLQTTNIGALTLPEPQAQIEMPFDPERDISEKAVVEAIRYAREHYTEADHTPRNTLLRNVQIIFPGWFSDEISEEKIPHETTLYEAASLDNELGQYVDRIKGNHNPNPSHNLIQDIDNFMEAVITTKILYPNYGKAGSKALQEFNEVLDKSARVFGKGSTLAEAFAANLLIHEPNVVIEINYLDWADAEGIVRESRSKENLAFVLFPEMAAAMRLARPSSMRDFIVTPGEWKKMHQLLKEFRGNDWESYMSLAASMKVLAAKEVLFTENGLELVMQESQVKLTEEIPSLPETRKF